MSERRYPKIYQIPWKSFLLFMFSFMVLISSNIHRNCANLPMFLLSLLLPLQWWFIKLSADRPTRSIVSFIRRACTSKAQAAELRKTHPARPPPKPDPKRKHISVTNPRLYRHQTKEIAKRLSNDVAECALRAKVFLLPPISVCCLSLPLRGSLLHCLWPLCIVIGIDLMALWMQHVWILVGRVLDNKANRSNSRPTLAFVQTPTKQHHNATRAVIYTAPTGVLVEWASSLWWILLTLNLFKMVISYVGGWEASVEFVEECIKVKYGKNYLPRILSLRWFIKSAFSTPLRVLLFVLLDVPAALKDIWIKDSMDTLVKLTADLDELLGVNRRAHNWTWIDNCSPRSGLHDPTVVNVTATMR
jgi:hypothetical protein